MSRVHGGGGGVGGVVVKVIMSGYVGGIACVARGFRGVGAAVGVDKCWRRLMCRQGRRSCRYIGSVIEVDSPLARALLVLVVGPGGNLASAGCCLRGIAESILRPRVGA